MKKFLISLLSIALGGAVVVILFLSLAKESGPKYVYKGNTERLPISIKPNEYQCSECNMDIKDLQYSAEIITKDGITYFFDDIACVVLWLKEHKLEDPIIITQTLDTHRWIDVKDAWYTRTASSPMGYGMASYEHKKDKLIPFEEMKLLVLQGKTLHDPFVKKSLLSQ
ncbi:hypothetical protein MNB_SV-6-615 [hydrothermal vent metagenome]|uniref:Nitrous oxide reductase maturation protein, outer-membrane lipoprotein NosL n=1 Tax=hydrothermal vent metagenome TaxID=652676 RepID=A0A1W1CC55_9ZZZZ